MINVDFSYVPKELKETAERLITQCWHDVLLPYIVQTPEPYIVDLANYKTAQDKETVISKLNKSVQKLEGILNELGISKDDARENKYTLNKKTEWKLYSIAIDKRNTKACKMINNHKW